MSDTYIQFSKSGEAQSFVGPDAVNLYALVSLKGAIRLHSRCGMIPTRGYTITRMLARATEITGKPYKGAGKHDRAIADLDLTIAAAKAAMPMIDHEGKPV